MPGLLVHVGAAGQCPHAGPLTFTTTNTRVMVGTQAVVTLSDVPTVGGCPFQVPIPTGTKPQPCVTVRWLRPRVALSTPAAPNSR